MSNTYEQYIAVKRELGAVLNEVKLCWDTIAKKLTMKQYHKIISVNYFDKARQVQTVSKDKKLLAIADYMLELEVMFMEINKRYADLREQLKND